jgi:hypothetical protein
MVDLFYLYTETGLAIVFSREHARKGTTDLLRNIRCNIHESILVVCATPVIPAVFYACFILSVLILEFA